MFFCKAEMDAIFFSDILVLFLRDLSAGRSSHFYEADGMDQKKLMTLQKIICPSKMCLLIGSIDKLSFSRGSPNILYFRMHG